MRRKDINELMNDLMKELRVMKTIGFVIPNLLIPLRCLSFILRIVNN